MSTTSLAAIREMTPDEIQQHADTLYAKCNCDILSLTPTEHEEIKACARNYFEMTGQALKASACETFQIH